MLKEKIINPWLKLQISNILNISEEEERKIAKQAFLYVLKIPESRMEHWDVTRIIKKYPTVINEINDDELFESFKSLVKESERLWGVVLLENLDFVASCAKNSKTIMEIERICFRLYMLNYDRPYFRMHKQRKWLIPRKERLGIVQEIIEEFHGLKLAIYLAKEFRKPTKKLYQKLCHKDKMEIIGNIIKNSPKNEWNEKITAMFGNKKGKLILEEYYEELLINERFNEAETFGNYPDVIFKVLLLMINKDSLWKASEFAKRFMPERKEIIEEIKILEDTSRRFSIITA